MKTIEEINRICPYKSNEWQQGYGIWQSGFIEGEKIGAEEQRRIDVDKAKGAFNKACSWLSIYPWYSAVLGQFIEAM